MILFEGQSEVMHVTAGGTPWNYPVIMLHILLIACTELFNPENSLILTTVVNIRLKEKKETFHSFHSSN